MILNPSRDKSNARHVVRTIHDHTTSAKSFDKPRIMNVCDGCIPIKDEYPHMMIEPSFF